MGDVGDYWREHKEYVRSRRQRNLDAAYTETRNDRLLYADRAGWTMHTEYHWSRILNGKRLDYWPSRNKFMYDGRVMCGDVNGFIRNREVL